MITELYLRSKGAGPRIRVGVLFDGPTVPRYAAAIVEDVARSDFASIELVVALRPREPERQRLGSALHAIYTRVDRAAGGDRDPLARVEPRTGLAGVDRVEVVEGDANGPWLAGEAVEAIRRRSLDVLLRFSAARPRGDVLHAARYGVWSYHFGGDADGRDGLPFFQQVVDRAPTRDVQLEVLEEEPGAGLVLCRSTFGNQGNLLLAHHRHVALWETTHFVVWKLRDLHEYGWEHVLRQAVARSTTHAAGAASTPTNGDLVRFLVPRVTAAIGHRIRGERRDHGVPLRWQIALRRTESEAAFGNTPDRTSLAGFQWHDAPQGHYYADPFLIEHGGVPFVLFEDYEYAKRQGVIGGAQVRADATLGPPFVCLDLGVHMSFPHVFPHEGELFMIPESLSDGTVTLYRARRFPADWVKEKVLFRGKATDTTSWRQDGRHYFFTTVHDRDDRGMKTLLFVADALTAPWTLHPANPVSSDALHARSAGAIFRRHGRLFRPSQDCGPRYGYGLNLEEVVDLSKDRYGERTWCSVDARALPFTAIGVHTYNQCGGLEAIDACVSLGTRFPLPRWDGPAR